MSESIETKESATQNLAMLIGMAIGREMLTCDQRDCAVESLTILALAAGVDEQVLFAALK